MDREELIAAYEKGIAVFAEAVRDLPGEIVDRVPAPGKWSIRQIAIHLADSELMAAGRMRLIAAQPGSQIKAYDQDAWAANLGYSGQSIKTAVELFAAIRRATAGMLRALPDAAWSNTAVHEERGPMELRAMVELYVGHVAEHARQIRELRARFAPAAGAR